jgi:hypothetical protein
LQLIADVIGNSLHANWEELFVRIERHVRIFLVKLQHRRVSEKRPIELIKISGRSDWLLRLLSSG